MQWECQNGERSQLIVIIGARTKDLLIFEKELAEVSNLYVTSDDGSTGRKGLVTDVLRQLVASGKSMTRPSPSVR